MNTDAKKILNKTHLNQMQQCIQRMLYHGPVGLSQQRKGILTLKIREVTQDSRCRTILDSPPLGDTLTLQLHTEQLPLKTNRAASHQANNEKASSKCVGKTHNLHISPTRVWGPQLGGTRRPKASPWGKGFVPPMGHPSFKELHPRDKPPKHLL